MSKKKGGKRLNKKMIAEMLQTFFQQNPNEVFSFKQIFKALKLDTHPAKMLAIDTMDEMTWDDYLTKTSDNSYRLNLKTQVQEGTFIRKSNGKNSFQPDDGGKPIFVSERNSMFALNGDRVRVAMMARRQNHIKEAMVVEVLSHKMDQAVGKLKVEKDFAFLVTEGNIFAQDILIPKKKLKGGKTGDKAVVKITQWPSKDSKNLVGEVIDVLGKEGDNNVEMHAILAQYGLPYKYPKAIEDAAEKIEPGITAEEIARREDFRDVWTCTIDPKDAKDFDDALSIRPAGKGLWEVGVHIADVSHYVNFICSLRPDEEKLCYSVIVVLDDDANIKQGRIVHTVIKSNRRYAYEEVQDILMGKSQTSEPAEYADSLKTLDRLAKKLREKRFKGGAVKFDREELHFDIDADGKPTRAYFKKSTDATQLIEEFMLLANKFVAESIGMKKKPKANGQQQKAKTFVYRIHDQPDPTKLENLREFVVKFGYKLKTGGTKGAISKSLNSLMDGCQGKKEQTKYQDGGRSANQDKYEELCEHCSDMEVVAQQAERDSIKYKMVEFMVDKVGEVYDAHISGIQSYGIYCEIDENHCEGMVPMRDLDDDYYDFDERNYCLVGRRHHNKYQLGDPIRIKVARANMEKRQLDFALAED